MGACRHEALGWDLAFMWGGTMEKKRLSAKEVLKDIRAGMSDQELMDKYDLSPGGLQSLFEKLMKAGLLTQDHLDRRTSGSQGTNTGTQRRIDDPTVTLKEQAMHVPPAFKFLCPACKAPHTEEYAVCPQCGIIVEKFLAKPTVEAKGTNLVEPLSAAAGESPTVVFLLRHVRKIVRIFFGFMLAWLVAGFLASTWFWFVSCLLVLTAIAISAVTYIGWPERSALALIAVLLLILNVGIGLYRLSPSGPAKQGPELSRPHEQQKQEHGGRERAAGTARQTNRASTLDATRPHFSVTECEQGKRNMATCVRKARAEIQRLTKEISEFYELIRYGDEAARFLSDRERRAWNSERAQALQDIRSAESQIRELATYEAQCADALRVFERECF